MQCYSTKNTAIRVPLAQAVLQGLAPDGGLFMPVQIPQLEEKVRAAFPNMSFKEIALEMARPFLGDEVPEKALQNIIERAFDFEAPLHALDENLFILELFHGPTLAFKDFGARFMAQLMAWLRRNAQDEAFILVATSGDTGSAVANGFYQVPGFRVVLLYPSGMVSEIQEKQLTTMGGNVMALEIKGTFDDCQRLVKQAFTDDDLRQSRTLSSANSINIARLIPQSFYYASAWAQLAQSKVQPIVSVPSGNLGNLTAGVLAQRMGIPIARFVSAMNVNDVFREYLQTEDFNPRTAVPTLSNAMDVGNPSNFFRLKELFAHNPQAMRHLISGWRVTDEETRATIAAVYERFGYVLDPHGAVGFKAMEETVHQIGARFAPRIILETAHPAKFKTTVEACIGREVEVPERLRKTLQKPKKALPLSNTFADFKDWLMAQS